MQIVSIRRFSDSGAWYLYLRIDRHTRPVKISKPEAEKLKTEYNLAKIEKGLEIWYRPQVKNSDVPF